MNSNTSSIGVKGSEDLGNGMSAFFKMEYQSDITEGGALVGRDQYIGLKMERFGKLTFGTTSTAYKSPGSKIDAFYRTNLQSRGTGLQSNPGQQFDRPPSLSYRSLFRKHGDSSP